MTSSINRDSTPLPEGLKLFRESLTTFRRRSGHLQKELADALGIDAQVLSRKLHGARRSFPTHAEVKQIIKTLADWDAITTRIEAAQLLKLMGLKTETFTELEWKTPPLAKLEVEPPYKSSAITTPQQTTAFRALSLLPNPATGLIGREYHVQLLLDRLRHRSVRLLTLYGMGGVGKTRLALEVAHAVQHDFADGVFFIPLSSLREAALIPATIVQTLHLMEPIRDRNTDKQSVFSHEDVLKNFLRDKTLLLVFDNVEQIPGIAAFISDLLQSARDIKIMVTSRILLHLYGEYEFDVPPLTIDTFEQEASPETYTQFSAVRLFVERAQAVNPAFDLTPENATTVSHICTRLDGLPLAIELAAARSKVLSLPEILQRLTEGASQSFLHTTAYNALQGHQTLQATLDWSYKLLLAADQALFCRYSVFVGGWTLKAALAIVMFDKPEATIDAVAAQIEFLIDQSLVKRMRPEEFSSEENQEPRFYLLETIREYTMRQLEASGERADIQQRHARYYLELVARTESNVSDSGQSASIALLVREQGNLRAVLAWATEHEETESALRISNALGKFWEARMQFREAHRWIDAVFKMQADTSLTAQANLLMGSARLALWEIGYERSRELAEEALKLYEASGNHFGKTWALFQIGDTWHIQGDYAQATTYLEQCLHLLYEQQDWRSYAFTLSRLGALATLQGNMQQAHMRLSEAMQLLREYPEPGLLTVTLIYLGVLSFLQNDLKSSYAYLREGLLLARQAGNLYMLATALIVLGCMQGRVHGPSYAAHICSAAEDLYKSLHTTVPTAYHQLYHVHLSKIQTLVDRATWETWWAEGKDYSLEEICKLAMFERVSKAT
ncbi:hypothetical protein KDA_55810 [Dictyobacter alpinus]|uniref:NB-ARC domain-containing protein n=1 Tax=Dictyobacter alpinus TaxID=2014873 RepID=A0A402BFQ3_9CHLR|nr:NB-ARC domain-containing protein [Dictyobacter alpinus]GCE30097.1 hypothetical protein KDA_55810 [Dictyobacter alpinus]